MVFGSETNGVHDTILSFPAADADCMIAPHPPGTRWPTIAAADNPPIT